MNKQKVVILKGLPASGKSSYARKWVSEDPDNRVMVEKDEIRKNSQLFKDGVYNHKRGDERLVIRERDHLIREALSQGKSVISSDTNLARKHSKAISKIAREFGASVGIKEFLDVPLAELIRRDAERENSVGEQAIRKMFHMFVKKMPTFLEYDPALDWVLVCDLDGTLTNGPKDRPPYDWSKVGNDDINLGVAAILDSMQVVHGKNGVNDMKTFIFSGRSEVCRKETEEWLEHNCVDYDKLVMRAENDRRKDFVVKSDFLEKYIKGKYNILVWLDDRPQVATHLRDYYGVNVLQRGDTRYEF